jgi:hypothetical protein
LAASPARRTEFAQSTRSRVVEATYLVAPFRAVGRRVVGDVGPVGGEDLVGFAPEQQVEGLAHQLAHVRAHGVVAVPGRPAAVAEAAGRVLLGTARGLHHAVEGEEGVDNQGTHRPASFGSRYKVRRRCHAKVIAKADPAVSRHTYRADGVLVEPDVARW